MNRDEIKEEIRRFIVNYGHAEKNPEQRFFRDLISQICITSNAICRVRDESKNGDFRKLFDFINALDKNAKRLDVFIRDRKLSISVKKVEE